MRDGMEGLGREEGGMTVDPLRMRGLGQGIAGESGVGRLPRDKARLRLAAGTVMISLCK